MEDPPEGLKMFNKIVGSILDGKVDYFSKYSDIDKMGVRTKSRQRKMT